jgi:hypothetical protein
MIEPKHRPVSDSDSVAGKGHAGNVQLAIDSVDSSDCL